jgi:hypothetical protein
MDLYSKVHVGSTDLALGPGPGRQVLAGQATG